MAARRRRGIPKLGAPGLVLGGRECDWLSGSLHYWRIDPALWSDILARCADMGLEIICSYVPWSVHELGTDNFDFRGRRDVRRFCELAADQGLAVQLRPGPHINAELTGFGFPARVLADSRIMARGPAGTPVWIPAPPQAFAVPSYASTNFWSEVARWFDALAPILAPLLAPRGPVFAVQADNENSYFFRTAPFDLDYHPESIVGYRQWLRERYGERAAMAEAWGRRSTELPDFDEVSAPVRVDGDTPGELRRIMDWVEWKDELAMRGLLTCAELLRERFPDDTAPLVTHNYPPSDLLSPPMDVAGGEARGLDIQGFDLYPQREQAPWLLRQARILLGGSRFPMIPELGAGSSMWIAPLSLDDQRFTTPYLAMHGVSGMNFYMFVERERWYGSPVTERGEERPAEGEVYRRLLAAFREIRLSSLETPSEVLLFAPRCLRRAAQASYLLSPVPSLALVLAGRGPEMFCSEQEFGLGRPVAIDFESELAFWQEALVSRQVPFRIVDEQAELELDQRRLVLVPGLGMLDGAAAERLCEWQASGSRVVIGPELPERDARMRQGSAAHSGLITLRRLAAEGRIAIYDRRHDSEAVEEILASHRPAGTETLAAGLEVVIKRRAGSSRPGSEIGTETDDETDSEILFLANPSAEERRTPWPAQLLPTEAERVYGEALKVDDRERAELLVPAWSVSIWRRRRVVVDE